MLFKEWSGDAMDVCQTVPEATISDEVWQVWLWWKFLEPHFQAVWSGWKWRFPTISHIKIWNHPIETTLKKWLFRVPGSSTFQFLGRFLVWLGVVPWPKMPVSARIVIFLVVDPELNLHLPLLRGGGTTQGLTNMLEFRGRFFRFEFCRCCNKKRPMICPWVDLLCFQAVNYIIRKLSFLL